MQIRWLPGRVAHHSVDLAIELAPAVEVQGPEQASRFYRETSAGADRPAYRREDAAGRAAPRTCQQAANNGAATDRYVSMELGSAGSPAQQISRSATLRICVTIVRASP